MTGQYVSNPYISGSANVLQDQEAIRTPEEVYRLVGNVQGTWNVFAVPSQSLTINALGGEEVIVVVTTGGRDISQLNVPLPTNTYVAEHIPHDQLLPKVDVMVTNGGYGAVQRALSAGVPLVVAGNTEDKPEVAARVTWSGAGINLRTGTPTATAVRTAVRTGACATASRRASP